MYKFKFLPKEKMSSLPKESGAYAFLARQGPDEGKKKGANLLYIGKAANIRERVKQHLPSPVKRGEVGFAELRSSHALRSARADEAKPQRPVQPAYRDNLFINQVSKVGYIKTNSEIEALILEANLIKKYQPKYNVVWKDSKNYFYVAITKEDFPRIFITHQPLKIRNSDFEYLGPFVDGKALKQTLKILRKVFPYRSCRLIPSQPCLWYHLNRCPAPCLLKISKIPSLCSSRILEKMKANMKKECQRNIKNLIKILKEGKNPVLKNLRKEMKDASKNQDFETAGKIRDQIRALEKVMEHVKVFEVVDFRHQPGESWDKTKKILQRVLKTKQEISRIEAYDVSNIFGKLATGSMITFVNGLADKNFYRRFKIKISGKPNDTAMIKEILTRRFNHKEWPYPDLILIDGGKQQLNAALKIKNQKFHSPFFDESKKESKKIKPFNLKQGQKVRGKKIKNELKVIALAKKKNELFIEDYKKPILLKNLPREVFNLILQLRDQAHRFAIAYHRKLRTKNLINKK